MVKYLDVAFIKYNIFKKSAYLKITYFTIHKFLNIFLLNIIYIKIENIVNIILMKSNVHFLNVTRDRNN